MKAQGSTSYIVLFAVVLALAVTVYYVISSGSNGEKEIMKKSRLYWSKAAPLSITYFATDMEGNLTLTLANHHQAALRIVNITFGDVSNPALVLIPDSSNDIFYPGSEKDFKCSSYYLSSPDNSYIKCAKRGDLKFLDVTIYYSLVSQPDTILAQSGLEPLVIKCPRKGLHFHC